MLTAYRIWYKVRRLCAADDFKLICKFGYITPKIRIVKKNLFIIVKIKNNKRCKTVEMGKIIYIVFILFSLSIIGQTENIKKDFRVDLLTIEKNTRDTLIGTFTEIYSGNKRIKAECCTDFDGIDIFYINPKDIVDNRIYMKFYGRKCKPYKKKFIIRGDLKTTIYLKYGKTEYNSKIEDFEMMFKKLNIEYDTFKCGTID